AAGMALGQYVAANFLLPLAGQGAAPPGGSSVREGGPSVLLLQAPVHSLSAFTVGLHAGDGPGIHARLPSASLTGGIYSADSDTAGNARSASLRPLGAEAARHAHQQYDPSVSPDQMFLSLEWREGMAASSPWIGGDV